MSAQPPTPTTLPFLEQRSYLHGTTLFQHLTQGVSGAADLRFKINRMMETNRVEVHRLGADGPENQALAASLHWTESGRKQGLGVVPLPPVEPVERLPYDEPAIVARATFDDASAHLTGATGHSLVANLVAVNKALLKRNLEPATAGQWVFTRLDLARLPESPAPFVLRIARTLGTRLVESAISMEDAPLGSIFFSWMER